MNFDNSESELMVTFTGAKTKQNKTKQIITQHAFTYMKQKKLQYTRRNTTQLAPVNMIQDTLHIFHFASSQ